MKRMIVGTHYRQATPRPDERQDEADALTHDDPLMYLHSLGYDVSEARVITLLEPKPGDLCRLLGNYEVEHHDCDEFADGVVTNVLTGKIVRRNEQKDN